MYTRKHIDFFLNLFRAERGSQPSTGLVDSDWDEVIQLAIRHRVAPLLCARLRTFPAQDIPVRVLKILEKEYLTSAMANMVLFNEFSRIFNVFNENGLACIALKGAHLAELVYSDPALRIMADLDILVKEVELSGAASLLQQMGYCTWNKTSDDPANHHLPPFIKKGAMPVEIHWGLHRVELPVTADIAGVWERAVPARLGSGKTLVLSVEDLLLQLSVHAFQHNFDLPLCSIYDVYETIRSHQSKINWKELESRAHHWNAEKPLFLMLLLSVDLLGAAVSPEFLERMRPGDFNPDFQEFAINQMFERTKAVSERMAEMYRTRSLRGKIRILLKVLFDSSECSPGERPVSLISKLLYPLRRVKSHLRNHYGQSMWQMFHAEEKDLLLTNPDTTKNLMDWLFCEIEIPDNVKEYPSVPDDVADRRRSGLLGQ